MKTLPLSNILFNYSVSITLFTQTLLFIFLTLSFFNTLYILRNYKKGSYTELQYSLEKRSYLLFVTIKIALIIKIVLLIFFTYTLNELSTLITGAMCSAGVITANNYGEPLLILKLLLILFAMLWLTLNKEDTHSKKMPYFKTKMYLFTLIYSFAFIEIVLELLFFTNLSTQKSVSCCSSIYSSVDEIMFFGFNISSLKLVTLFYLLFFATILSALLKKKYLLLFFSILFTYISYLSVVYFFSMYIYQLPSHHCPYCLLQSEYNYIGYFIYSSFIVALYYSISAFFFNFLKKSFIYSIMFYSIFLFCVSIHFLIFLIVNRTLLC